MIAKYYTSLTYFKVKLYSIEMIEFNRLLLLRTSMKMLKYLQMETLITYYIACNCVLFDLNILRAWAMNIMKGNDILCLTLKIILADSCNIFHFAI